MEMHNPKRKSQNLFPFDHTNYQKSECLHRPQNHHWSRWFSFYCSPCSS